MSLNTTDSFGRDVSIPHEVRIYQLSGTQHGGGSRSATAGGAPGRANNCQPARTATRSPRPARLLVRCDWVVGGRSSEAPTRQLVVAAW